MPVVTEKDREVLGELADVYRELMINNPHNDVYQNAYVQVITALALCHLVDRVQSMLETLTDISLDTTRL